MGTLDHNPLILKVCIHVSVRVKNMKYLPTKKVKSLFWVHIQAQSSALQTLTSTFPGHWAFTVHISTWISISTPWGVYSHSHAARRHGLQICPHRYPFAPGSREAMQRDVPCSWGTRSRRTGRALNPSLDLDPNPESCTTAGPTGRKMLVVLTYLCPW